MTTAPIPVRPRRDGEPVPDLLGMRLAHRAVLRDAARLSELAERLAAGTGALGQHRAVAVAAYVRDWADSVHRHCAAEDELVWPVLASSAGPSVDLSELRDDHAALEPALERLRRAGDAFAARPGEDTATALAVELAELRDALVEHVGDEEAVVLPALERWVGARDWRRVQARTVRRARWSFELPRSSAVLAPHERRRAGVLLRLGALVLGPAFRRRERVVFGRPA